MSAESHARSLSADGAPHRRARPGEHRTHRRPGDDLVDTRRGAQDNGGGAYGSSWRRLDSPDVGGRRS